MNSETATQTPEDETLPSVPEHPFIKEMLRQLRASDTYGFYDNASPAELLKPFVVTKAQRKQLPLVADPDDQVIGRLKNWYAAIAMQIEAGSGRMASPLMNLSSEGFGRVVIIAGHLVVVDRTLREVHRFGFISLEKMCEDADRLVASALALIEAHPAAAEG